jgi:ABC-type multidrug transport system fused ATPase/permease subunit
VSNPVFLVLKHYYFDACCIIVLAESARPERVMKYPRWTRPFVEEPAAQHEDPATKPASTLPWTAAFIILFTSIGLSCQLVLIIVPSIGTVANIVLASVWAAIAVLWISWRPRIGSPTRCLGFACVLVAHVTLLLVEERYRHGFERTFNLISTLVSALIVLIELNTPLRDPLMPKDGISRPGSRPTEELRSPEDNLTTWQWMAVTWMAPLIRIGSKRQLNTSDVWFLPYEFQHLHLHNAFRELRGSVLRRLLYANWKDLCILTVLGFAELAADYSTPVILQALLKAMGRIAYEKGPAMKVALLMLVVRLADAQVQVLALWFGRRAYERSRGEMMTMLYEKTLKRKIVGHVPDTQEQQPGDTRHAESNGHASYEHGGDETDGLLNGNFKKPKAGLGWFKRFRKSLGLSWGKRPAKLEGQQPASMGKLLNVLRNDCYEVAQRFWEFQTLIFAPFGTIISAFLVWRLLGWACLLGIAVVIVAQIVNALLVKILIRFEVKRRLATDTKLQRISQYVEAIRHLRWFGWHSSWLEGIMSARQHELNLKVVTQLWALLIVFVNQLGSGILPVAAFFAYTALAKQELRVDVAFPALQLFAMLQRRLQQLPNLITVMLNAKVAMGRLESFMNEPDKPENPAADASDQLELQNASFAWPGTSHTVLRNVNVTFPQGLSLVVGRVGAGKTALLQGLLGELDLEEGHLVKPAATPIAYCLQTPWLESMSIRDNILFNSPYNDDRYKRTLDACALTPDLATFTNGDLSPIGENGIGLSGGQKARVALARAIYSNAPILLLDDPISALDQQTAEWIVKRCFTGKLVKGRTLVLVTHRTDLCQNIAVQTIEIVDGTARPVQGLYVEQQDELTQILSSEQRGDAEQKQMEEAAVRDKFEDEEHRAHGGVQLAVYWEYIKAGRLKWWFFLAIFASAFQFLRVAESWYLKEWGEAYNRGMEEFFGALSFPSNIGMLETPISSIFKRFPDPSDDVYPWLRGYFGIVALGPVVLVVGQGFMVLITYVAGKAMFREIMLRISNAPFRYYDVTPVGRLLNRLTSDAGTLDGNISNQFTQVIFQGIAWVSSVIVFAGVTPAFLVFSLLLTGTFVWIFTMFLPTSQSLRRLEMVSLSPLLSNFGALLGGLTTVRAFCAQPAFLARVISVVDEFQRNDHFYWSLQGWLMYRFDVLSSFSTFALTCLAVYSSLTPGLTAFVLVAAQNFVMSTHALCRQYGQLQLDFVSVERVVELIHLEKEEPGDTKPPASWPRYGSDIEFQDVTIKYMPTAPAAVSNFSLTLAGGKHTAIFGRTGSGKSTLSLSLLATTPLSTGKILIDGIDISRVEKTTLRSRITLLAQDPILFPGSLRHNLDPQSEHGDAECLSALSLACLDTTRFTLNFEVAAHGNNLSQGQRQLVSLARALLRKSAVVIMDEATASVDLQTAEQVYRVVREELQSQGSTIVSVAHRRGAMEGVDATVTLVGGRVESVE